MLPLSSMIFCGGFWGNTRVIALHCTVLGSCALECCALYVNAAAAAQLTYSHPLV